MKQLKLLCVDDDEGIIKALQRVLKSESYEVFFAYSGHEALELMEQNEFQVVLSDLMMPHMSGTELLATVKDKYQDIIRLILTGADDQNLIANLINTGSIYRYVTKPWVNEELKSIINQCFQFYKINLDNKRLVRENKKISEDLVEMNLRLNSDKENKEKLLQVYSEVLNAVTAPVIYIDSFCKTVKANNSAKDMFNIKAEDTLENLFSRLDARVVQVLKQYVEVEYRQDITLIEAQSTQLKIKSLGSPNDYMGLVMIGE